MVQKVFEPSKFSYNMFYFFAGDIPWYRKVVNWVCGIENVTGASSIATQQVQTQDMLSIKQDKRWKITSNIAAVIVMIICIALCVIFR